jgi:hypothetical protein
MIRFLPRWRQVVVAAAIPVAATVAFASSAFAWCPLNLKSECGPNNTAVFTVTVIQRVTGGEEHGTPDYVAGRTYELEARFKPAGDNTTWTAWQNPHVSFVWPNDKGKNGDKFVKVIPVTLDKPGLVAGEWQVRVKGQNDTTSNVDVQKDECFTGTPTPAPTPTPTAIPTPKPSTGTTPGLPATGFAA